jgi:hypothetical protein
VTSVPGGSTFVVRKITPLAQRGTPVVKNGMPVIEKVTENMLATQMFIDRTKLLLPWRKQVQALNSSHK